jgi:hypothetical protein
MSKLCGNPDCGASIGIHGGVTFGSGELDGYGFWEKPCYVCARQWEALYPNEKAWPFEKGEERDKQEDKELLLNARCDEDWD